METRQPNKRIPYNNVTILEDKIVKKYTQGTDVEKRERFVQEMMALVQIRSLSDVCYVPKLIWADRQEGSDSSIEIEKVDFTHDLDALLYAGDIGQAIQAMQVCSSFLEEISEKTFIGKRMPYKIAQRIEKYLGIYGSLITPEADKVSRQAAGSLEPMAFSLCHGDMKLDNVLLGHHRQCPVVIDWEHYAIGESIYDVATMVANAAVKLLIHDKHEDAIQMCNAFDRTEYCKNGLFPGILSRTLLEFSPGIKRMEYTNGMPDEQYKEKAAAVINAMAYSAAEATLTKTDSLSGLLYNAMGRLP